MARPVAAFIQLPSDSGNTGKKQRTQSRVVGSDTVHEHFVIPITREKLTGTYYFAHAVQSVQASAQNGTSTGFWWLEVPSGATIRARLRRYRHFYDWGAVPAADVPTIPRILVARFTFTGTASAGALTAGKRASSDAANVANLRTGTTGMTITLGAHMFGSMAPFVDFATAVGINTQPREVHQYEPLGDDEFIELDAAEGLLMYQPDAGTASDLRRFFGWGCWDEFDDA